MPELLTIEAATAAREAAHAAHENILAEIKTAEQSIANTTPAAAIAAGGSLAEASRAQTEAKHRLEFLHESKDLAWTKFLESDATMNFAKIHAVWSGKLAAAIDARVAAATAYEDALAAKAAAETSYLAATATIAAAHSAGMPKPARLHEFPLHLPGIINHTVQIQIRPAAEERAFWESAK